MFDATFLSELKTRFTDVLSQITKQNRENKWICPLCESGSRKNATSAFEIYEDGAEGYYCFSCGKGGDLFNLVCEKYKLEFRDGVAKVCELLGKSFPEESIRKNERKKEQDVSVFQSPKADFSEYVERCVSDLASSGEARRYLSDRGFSEETILRFRLGCDSHENAIVIPYGQDSSYYITRSISGEKAYRKPSKENGGPEPVFNLDALYGQKNGPSGDSNACVFITEGQLDAISIEQLGYRAIASGGGGYRKLAESVVNIVDRPRVIVAFDNDDAGTRNAQNLSSELKAKNVAHSVKNLTKDLECKDANEALVKCPNKFSNVLERIVKLSSIESATPDSDLLYVEENFLQDKIQFQSYRRFSTGFKVLDNCLGGGIYPGLYVVGAATSLGKTTFCHQMASHMAHVGANVLFFSLEMSKFEMVSRGIAREIGRHDSNKAISALDVRRLDQNDDIRKGMKYYTDFTKGNLNTIQCDFGYTVENVIEYAEGFLSKNPTASLVIFVDYLQILSARANSGKDLVRREEIDSIVTSLKLFSSKYKIPVFVVSSLNRGNYILPVSFESFKESGGIEYTADVVIGLQLECLSGDLFEKKEDVKKKRETIRKAMSDSPRIIELLILKNRFGIASGNIFYDYHSKYDLFNNERKTLILNSDES